MLARIRSLTPMCWVAQSATYATNSGILVAGRDAYLIDPGVSLAELDGIAAFVSDRGAVVRGIVLTHAHWDHLLGPSYFLDTPVIAHVAYRSVVRAHADDLRRQVAHWAADQGVPEPSAFAPPTPDVTFSTKMSVQLGAHALWVIAAPGHAPDHAVVYLPTEGLLWAGDMLSNLEIPMVMDTFAGYRRTLRDLAGLRIDALVPGHGTPTTDPHEIHGRFVQDQAYLRAVEGCAAEAYARGASLAEAVVHCEHISFAQPDSYPNAHRWNIEQAFVEMGGRVQGCVGWEQDWLVEE